MENFCKRGGACAPYAVRGSVTGFDDAISSSPHAHGIFLFIVTFSVSLVQIKYQGSDVSPFENQAITMLATIAILLIYCLSYYFVLRNSQHPSPSFSSSRLWSHASNYLVRAAMVFSCPLTIALLLSILYPGPKIKAVLFSVSTLISLIQLFGPQTKAILSWVKKAACDIMVKWLNDDQSHNRGVPAERQNVNLARRLQLQV